MILTYDHTFEGLLSAVFEVYEHKLVNACIRKEGIELPCLFEVPVHVCTDEIKVNRVTKKLKELIGEEGLVKLWKTWLTEKPDIEDCIYGTIRYAIEKKMDVLSDFGHLHVLQLNEHLKKIAREKHRMEAFVRFQLTRDQLYYSTVEPDFNVLPLLIRHFQERYADQRWLIFDRKRAYGIYYNLSTTEFVTFEGNHELNVAGKNLFQEDELLYQSLWKDYFKSTTIPSRKNTRLHLQHVPYRYWKYLTEKGIDFK